MKIHRKHLILFIVDIVLINTALWFSFFLRYEGMIPHLYRRNWFYLVLAATFIRVACFVAFGLYRSLWSYSSLPEMIQIFKAVVVSSVLQISLDYVLTGFSISRSVFVIDFGMVLILIGGARLLIRLRREIIYSWELKHKMTKRVLVVGAGQAGALIIREMLHEHAVTHRPVVVIDDNPDKLHHRLHGIPVGGNVQQLAQVAGKYDADEILVAIPSAAKDRLREIVEQAKKTGLPVRILPGLLEMADGKVSLRQAREVRIEDLLGRKQVRVNLDEIAGYLQGEKILITGAGGSIGAELCRQVSLFGPAALFLLGRGENSIYEIDRELAVTYPDLCRKPIIADIRDRVKMEQVFAEYRPTVVFHAAAHKHVPLMEDAPDEAVKNNIFGTKILVDLADKYEIKRFVQVSTDKAVNPTSIMGVTKRVAEMIVQHAAMRSDTKYCAVRFGNVLGSRGSIIPLFQKQIAAGGPVTVTHPEMMRYFMTIPEAVSLVVQAGAMGENGEIFVLDMGEPVRIVDLARDLIRLSGLEPEKDIKIQYCGIRPGEKLFEEILTAEEGTTATRHERIYVGIPNHLNWERFQEDLVYLEKWVAVANRVKVLEKLRQMVPRYRPSEQWQKEIASSRVDS